MKYEKIPHTTHTLPLGLPRYIEGSSEHAVLVLHGFTGITGNMAYLINRLSEEGFTVAAPRFPGHGTNFTDFHLTGWKDWLRRSIDVYLDLRGSYSKVYITGLSMGGVLALILAALFEVEKIALCAPALAVRNKLIYLTPIFRFIIPKLPTGYEEKSEDPQRRFLAGEYWSSRTSHSVYQLLRLQRYAKKLLPKVETDTLTLVSAADKSVPPKVAELIESRISSVRKRRVVLEKSSHVITEGEEKARVADEIIRWFEAQPNKA
ncbi:MAG: alpha/beta fold hydrolase [Spirochaetia bacterium]